MATIPIAQRAIDADLPQPALASALDRSGTIVLEYTMNAGIAVNQQPIALADVGTRLREIYRDRHDKTMYVMGDAALRYGAIVEVIDAAKGAGVEQVGIVTPRMRGTP